MILCISAGEGMSIFMRYDSISHAPTYRQCLVQNSSGCPRSCIFSCAMRKCTERRWRWERAQKCGGTWLGGCTVARREAPTLEQHIGILPWNTTVQLTDDYLTQKIAFYFNAVYDSSTFGLCTLAFLAVKRRLRVDSSCLRASNARFYRHGLRGAKVEA